MMVKKTTPPVQADAIDIGALRVNYPGRFEEREIPCGRTRVPLNAVCRALDGMAAIAAILYSNEIERQSQGSEAVTLDSKVAYGLYEALAFLAEHGSVNAQDLGDHLFEVAKGGAAC